MNAPVPLVAGYVRARRAIPVLVDQPIAQTGPRRFRGRLLGAMYSRGELHHYRVKDEGDGTLYLTPPHWLVEMPPMLIATAVEAGA